MVAIEEAESSIAAEALQALSGGLMFIDEVPAAVESIGPSTTTSPVCPTRVLAFHWATGEGDLGLMDSMKARELFLGVTPVVNVAVLLCMSMEEALACMYYYIVGVGGIFIESCGHNLC